MPAPEAGITGPRKAAVLLLQLGRDGAAQVMNRLSPSEVEEITTEIVRLRSVDTGTRRERPDRVPGPDVHRRRRRRRRRCRRRASCESAMGARGAPRRSWAGWPRPASASRSRSCADADPKLLLTFLVDEHPQTIALVLAHMRTDQAVGDPVRPRPADPGRRRPADRRDGERVAGPGAPRRGRAAPAGLARCSSRAARAPGSAACSRSSTSSTAPTRPPSGPSWRAWSSRTPRWPRRSARGCSCSTTSSRSRTGRAARAAPGRQRRAGRRPQGRLDHRPRQGAAATSPSGPARTSSEEIDLLGPQRLSAVEEAQAEVVQIIRTLEQSGEIVLRRGGDDEFVD